MTKLPFEPPIKPLVISKTHATTRGNGSNPFQDNSIHGFTRTHRLMMHAVLVPDMLLGPLDELLVNVQPVHGLHLRQHVDHWSRIGHQNHCIFLHMNFSSKKKSLAFVNLGRLRITA
jgi:hypothetical protein